MISIDPRIIVGWMLLHSVAASWVSTRTIITETHHSLSLHWYLVANIALWFFPILGVYLFLTHREFFREHRAWALACLLSSFLMWVVAGAHAVWGGIHG